MIRYSLLAVVTSALMAQAPAPPAAPKAAAPKPAVAAPEVPARDPGLYATFNTSMGPIVCVLYEKDAPATVKSFVALSRGGKAWTDPKTNQKVTRPLYSGTIFHRVIPNFMIQGGDPTGTGMGTGGIEPLPDEFSKTMNFDRPGRLAMANTGSPRSSAVQFFITEVPYPSLNGKYIIFGQVIEGQDLVSKIASVPRDASDKPKTPVRIVNIKITRYPLAPAAPRTAAPPAKKTAAPAASSAAKKTATPPAAAKKTTP